MKTTSARTALLFITTCLVSYILFVCTVENRRNDNWVAPYLSAAANLHPFGAFMIDEEEVIAFKDLPTKEQYRYRFSRSDRTVHYNHNPIGYAYIVWFASSIFFFLGQNYALILLQMLIHIFLCLLVLSRSKERLFRTLFICGYLLNPLIIYFVVLNYYYFWQCIPAFIILYAMLTPRIPGYLFALFSILLLFATLARPTILFLSLFTTIIYFKRLPVLQAVLHYTIMIVLFIAIYKPTQKNIWHTVYVGIAAYPNAHVQDLSDESGYALYAEATGTELDVQVGGNYYQPEITAKYTDITRDTCIQIFAEEPLMFVRNAVLNTGLSFSTGYFNGAGFLINALLSIAGFALLFFAIRLRLWFYILAILLYAGTFCLYYPPIQAYLFGGYLLTFILFYRILRSRWEHQQNLLPLQDPF